MRIHPAMLQRSGVSGEAAVVRAQFPVLQRNGVSGERLLLQPSVAALLRFQPAVLKRSGMRGERLRLPSGGAALTQINPQYCSGAGTCVVAADWAARSGTERHGIVATIVQVVQVLQVCDGRRVGRHVADARDHRAVAAARLLVDWFEARLAVQRFSRGGGDIHYLITVGRGEQPRRRAIINSANVHAVRGEEAEHVEHRAVLVGQLRVLQRLRGAARAARGAEGVAEQCSS